MPKKTFSPKFHVEFLNTVQKMAWAMFQTHDMMWLSGAAGCGKTFLASAFAVNELLQGKKNKIILTRPIIEAGEKLGFLPGDFHEKTDPYMHPIYDCLDQLVGVDGPQRLKINDNIEVAPLAFLRGKSLKNSICILDEAQNCTRTQLKLYLTRLDKNSKMIITGDPTQTDIINSGFNEVLEIVSKIAGVGTVFFNEECVVRHPIVKEVIKLL